MLKRHLLSFFSLLMAILVALIAAVSFQRKVEGFQPLGFAVVAQAGVYTVTELTHEVGLAVGDVILLVQGQQARSTTELRQWLTSLSSSEILVQRDAALLPVSYSRPPLSVDFAYLGLALTGLLYWVIGILSSLKDRQRSSGTFFLWTMVSALLFLASPRPALVDDVDRLIFCVDQLARVLLPALTLHFFFAFPLPLVGRRHLVPTFTLIYLPAAFLALYQADQIFGAGRLLGFGPASAAQLARFDRLELAYFVAAGLGSAALLFVRLVRSEGAWKASWEHRRQTWWIAAGLVAAFIPFVLFYLIPWTFSHEVPWWSSLLAVLPLGLLPLSFAWAIFKFRLLDLGTILREATAYGITTLLAIFGFQLVHLAVQSGLGEQTSMVRNLLTFGTGLVVAGLLVPARGAVAEGIARFQFRRNWGARRLLGTLGQELLFERNFDRLCDTLIQSLSDAMRAQVNLYLAQGEDGLVPFHLEGDLPRAVAFDVLGEDFWQREVVGLSSVVQPGARLSAENRLFVEGYRYAMPITVRNRRLGFVVLGYRLDDEPFANEDLDLVRGLLNQAALAIENAQLLDEVQQRLDQVSRLESYSKGILESTPAGLALIDAEDRVIVANHAFAALVGQSRQEILKAKIQTLLPIRPLPDPEDGLIEASYCDSSSREHYLQLRVALTHLDPGVAQRVLIIQDISDQVALENSLREKEHLASLGMLAAGVAHEVNTPLTGISSYAQFLLADTDPSDPRYVILKKMEKQTFRASEIVNNLLDFARNRRNEVLNRLRLDTLATEAIGLLEERLVAGEVAWEVELPAEPLWVDGNEGELHQVIANLVVNAIDAMQRQPTDRCLRVRLFQKEHKALLEVVDTGPGIPPDRLDTIFKPFFSSKLASGGSGLGLAISYNIVRRHGGYLTARNNSPSQRGCTFTVELPCRVAP